LWTPVLYSMLPSDQRQQDVPDRGGEKLDLDALRVLLESAQAAEDAVESVQEGGEQGPIVDALGEVLSHVVSQLHDSPVDNTTHEAATRPERDHDTTHPLSKELPHQEVQQESEQVSVEAAAQEEPDLSDIIRNALTLALGEQNEETGQETTVGDVVGNGEDEEQRHLEALQHLLGQAEPPRAQDQESGPSEEESNRTLLEQLTAALRDESVTVAETEDQLDTSARAVAELLANADIETSLTSLLAGHDESSSTSAVQKSGDGEKKSLSIAETLAISRNNMKNAREELANKVDPMLARRGYMHSWSSRPRQQESQWKTPQHQRLTMVDYRNSQPSAPEQPQVQTVVPEQSPVEHHEPTFHLYVPPEPTLVETQEQEMGDDSNMVAALLLARQMISASINEEEEEEEQQQQQQQQQHRHHHHHHQQEQQEQRQQQVDVEVSSETVEAFQAALQALSRSLAETEEQPGESSTGRPKQNRAYKIRRQRLNGELTAADKERIRIEARERKKRWRGNNTTRNKDNDLRARLQKRATNIYGPENSEEKTKWFENEFRIRREKRLTRQLTADGIDKLGGDDGPDSVSQMDDLRAALEALGRTTDMEGMSEAVSTLVKDPNLMRSLSSVFDMISAEDQPVQPVGKRSTTTTKTKFTLSTQSATTMAGGGLISSFKIKRMPTTTFKVPAGQPQYPSKSPDRGLTSLIRPVMARGKKNHNKLGGVEATTRIVQPSPLHEVVMNAPMEETMDDGDGGIDMDPSIRELAGLISEAVRQESAMAELTGYDRSTSEQEPVVATVSSPDSLSTTISSPAPDSNKRKRPDQRPPMHAPEQESRVTAGLVLDHLTVPTTVISSPRPPQYMTRPGSNRQEGRNVRPRIDDKRVKSLGFPPLLAGMTLKGDH
jgi:hypothetical protein